MGHFSTVWLISLEKNWSDLHEYFIIHVSFDKKVTTKFWKSSNGSGSERRIQTGCRLGGGLRALLFTWTWAVCNKCMVGWVIDLFL